MEILTAKQNAQKVQSPKMEKKILLWLFIMINALNIIDTFSTLVLLTYFPSMIYEYNAAVTQYCHISPVFFVLFKIIFVLLCTYILYRTSVKFNSKLGQVGLVIVNIVYPVLITYHLCVWTLLYKLLV